MNQAQMQSELTKSIANTLGYKGPISGFQKFIMSNQPASRKYAGILKAIDMTKNIAKQKAQRETSTPMPQMAQGGVVRKMQVGGLPTVPAGFKAPRQDEGIPSGPARYARIPEQMPNLVHPQVAEMKSMVAQPPKGSGDIPQGVSYINTEVFTDTATGQPMNLSAQQLDKQIAGQGIYASPAQLQAALRGGQQRIAKAELGGNMIPAGERNQTATLPTGGDGRTLPNDMIPDFFPDPRVPQGPTLVTTPTNQPPVQKFDKVKRAKVDTNQFLADGTTPNPNYGQPITDAEGNILTEEVAPNIGDISAQMITQPGLPAGAQIQTVSPVATQDTLVASGTGQVSGDFAVPTTVAGTATATPQQVTDANLMQSQQAAGQVEQALSQTQAAQGQVPSQAQIEAQQQTASSVGQLDAAQGVANQMTSPVQRQIQEGELISGVANAETASKFTEQIQAATATPSEKATVQGQLASLTANFDMSNPPPWAAGALRGIQAQLQQRGLGASSIAGQALIQGALESALPIAQADAQVTAQFEAQNLSNRQQRAMLAAQQRATFLGQEFDQAFQSRVQNASKIADVANTNFNAEQQIALENSRAANTMNLNNLSNKQALVMAEASALANLDLSNLSNRQQSAVQNAQNFLQMDMANLSNQQQANMFNAQQRVQSLFTDQAAENAARQFNATSQNQVDQFFASLGQQASQFNATQINAQEQFNAGQRNTVERFNAELNNQRDQFNAQNQMVIAQSNANWRRQIATQATASTNRANELNAQNVLGLSNQAYNNLWQYYGDTMEWAWTSAENERSRVIELAKAQLAADSNADIAKMKGDYNSSAAFGGLIGKFITGGLLGGGGFGGLF